MGWITPHWWSILISAREEMKEKIRMGSQGGDMEPSVVVVANCLCYKE